jgi:hypothetical protein
VSVGKVFRFLLSPSNMIGTAAMRRTVLFADHQRWWVTENCVLFEGGHGNMKFENPWPHE